MSKTFVLQVNPAKTDTSWRFTVPADVLRTRAPARGRIPGIMIKFKPDGIVLEPLNFPSNRILHDDDPSQFLLASFADLRFPDSNLSESATYISNFLKAGLFINNIQYRFYHHSNSQLVSPAQFFEMSLSYSSDIQRSRTCFLRKANDDLELDHRIYELGDYGRIMNVSKREQSRLPFGV